MKLNQYVIKNSEPKLRVYKLYDGNGLYLEVRPSGGKTWCYRYRLSGKERRLTLGTYPALTLTDARKRVLQARLMREDGKDPAREKQRRIHTERLAERNIFTAVVEEWFTLKSVRISQKVQRDQRRVIDRDILPALGKVAVKDITPSMLLDLITRINRERGVNIASQVLSMISGAMRHAIISGIITTNPARELSGVVQRDHRGQRLALRPDEIKKFLISLDSSRAHPYTQYALRLLLHTFVRPAEMCGAMWSEIDFDSQLWRIPAERMKMSRDHLVPLSPQVISLFQALKPLTGASKFVFPTGSQSGHTEPFTLSTAMLRMGWRDRATPHGFRALASSVLHERGFLPDAIERQLAHSEKNKVKAAYNRAEYLNDRRQIMLWWSNFIDSAS